MRGLRQKVYMDFERRPCGPHDLGTAESGEVEGTKHNNLYSKICGRLRQALSWDTTGGATIVIRIDPAEADELANPER